MDDVDAEIFCPDCGYNLRGISSVRCPECGFALDRAQLNRSQLPWTYRKELGRLRAYIKTVWLVISDPRRVGDEVARPVDPGDARSFRRTTVLYAFVPLAVAALYGLIVLKRRYDGITSLAGADYSSLPAPTGREWIGWALQDALAFVALFCVWLFVLCISGVASYFFHPSSLSIERQKRAVALSYYACAPLALTPLVVAAMAFLDRSLHQQLFAGRRILLPHALLAAVCVALPVIQLATLFSSPLRMLRRATHSGSARVWTAGLVIPLAWVTLGVLTLVAIPAAYLFLCVVILSMTP